MGRNITVCQVDFIDLTAMVNIEQKSCLAGVNLIILDVCFRNAYQAEVIIGQ